MTVGYFVKAMVNESSSPWCRAYQVGQAGASSEGGRGEGRDRPESVSPAIPSPVALGAISWGAGLANGSGVAL